MDQPKKPLEPFRALRGTGGGVHLRPPAPPDDDDQHELLAHSLERMQVALQDDVVAQKVLGESLRGGRITSWVWGEFNFLQLPETYWVTSPDKIAERIKKSRAPWLSTTDQWIFVDRRAIDSLLLKRARPVSSLFGFDMERTRWPLYDACIWAATKGADTTTGAIVDGRLDDRGAVLLFKVLAEQPLLDGVYVFGTSPGLNRRTEVLPGDWDSAHTGYQDHGNEILFYLKEDRTPGDERQYIAADMHRHRLLGPSLLDLWIRRDDLLKLYPSQAVGKGKRGPKSFDDSAYHVYMLELIQEARGRGAKLSINRAAEIAASAQPGHSEVSTKKRIADSFGKLYPEFKQTHHRG